MGRINLLFFVALGMGVLPNIFGLEGGWIIVQMIGAGYLVLNLVVQIATKGEGI